MGTISRKGIGGRKSIFRPKDGRRIQGDLTTPGTALFESRRRDLETRWGKDVSDADVVESFLHGDEATETAIQAGKSTEQ